MNIFKIRKFILTNLFLFNLINFSYPLQSSFLYRRSIELDNSDQYNLSDFPVLKNLSVDIKNKNFLEPSNDLASEAIFNQKFQLEIQSDKQHQQESILYAQGNVIANYRGNTLKADVLVYDKLRGVVEAEGNVILILGDQIFSAEKINHNKFRLFDFR